MMDDAVNTLFVPLVSVSNSQSEMAVKGVVHQTSATWLIKTGFHSWVGFDRAPCVYNSSTENLQLSKCIHVYLHSAVAVVIHQ